MIHHLTHVSYYKYRISVTAYTVGDAVSLGSAFSDRLFGPEICFLAFCFRLFFIRYQGYVVLMCLIFNKRIFKEKLDGVRSVCQKQIKIFCAVEKSRKSQPLLISIDMMIFLFIETTTFI
jgi:hypothetical protein